MRVRRFIAASVLVIVIGWVVGWASYWASGAIAADSPLPLFPKFYETFRFTGLTDPVVRTDLYQAIQTRQRRGNFSDRLFDWGQNPAAAGPRMDRPQFESMMDYLSKLAGKLGPEQADTWFNHYASRKGFRIGLSGNSTRAAIESGTFRANGFIEDVQSAAHDFGPDPDLSEAVAALHSPPEVFYATLERAYQRKKSLSGPIVRLGLLYESDEALFEYFLSTDVPETEKSRVFWAWRKLLAKKFRTYRLPGKLVQSLQENTFAGQPSFAGLWVSPMKSGDGVFRSILPGECVRTSPWRYALSLREDVSQWGVYKDGEELGYISILETVPTHPSEALARHVNLLEAENFPAGEALGNSQAPVAVRGILEEFQIEALEVGRTLAVPSKTLVTFNYKDIPAAIVLSPAFLGGTDIQVRAQSSRTRLLSKPVTSADDRRTTQLGYKAGDWIDAIATDGGVSRRLEITEAIAALHPDLVRRWYTDQFSPYIEESVLAKGLDDEGLEDDASELRASLSSSGFRRLRRLYELAVRLKAKGYVDFARSIDRQLVFAYEGQRAIDTNQSFSSQIGLLRQCPHAADCERIATALFVLAHEWEDLELLAETMRARSLSLRGQLWTQMVAHVHERATVGLRLPEERVLKLYETIIKQTSTVVEAWQISLLFEKLFTGTEDRSGLVDTILSRNVIRSFSDRHWLRDDFIFRLWQSGVRMLTGIESKTAYTNHMLARLPIRFELSARRSLSNQAQNIEDLHTIFESVPVWGQDESRYFDRGYEHLSALAAIAVNRLTVGTPTDAEAESTADLFEYFRFNGLQNLRPEIYLRVRDYLPTSALVRGAAYGGTPHPGLASDLEDFERIWRVSMQTLRPNETGTLIIRRETTEIFRDLCFRLRSQPPGVIRQFLAWTGKEAAGHAVQFVEKAPSLSGALSALVYSIPEDTHLTRSQVIRDLEALIPEVEVIRPPERPTRPWTASFGWCERMLKSLF